MNSFEINRRQQKIVLLLLFSSLVIMIIGFMLMISPTLFPKKHIVKFQLNNGEEDHVVLVKHNSIVSKIDDPIMDDYVFVGWALENELYQFNTLVTSDITLEAIWNKIDEPITTDEIIRYKVTFDSNGGSEIKSDTVIKNGLLNKPDDPIKKGYSFVGWKLNDNYYDFSTKVINDITLIAEWSKNSNDEGGSIESKPGSTQPNIPNSTPSQNPSSSTTPAPSSTTNPTSDKVTSISIAENLTIAKGKSTSLKVSYIPSSAKLTKLTWTSSNTSVATVDSSGKITAKKEGTTVITVKDTLNNTAKCTVTVAVSKVTSISLSKSSITLEKGKTSTLSVSHKPSDATLTTLTWTSSNTSVATIDGSGKITAKKAGTTVITVKDTLNNTAKCTVTVPVPKVTSISLSKSSVSLDKGNSITLSVSYQPTDAKLTTLTWSSSDTSVATVNSSGKITTKNVGTAVITVKDTLNNTAKCTVTVIQQPTSISLSATNINIKPGETQKILYSFFPHDTTEKGITWSSSNTRVASVSQSGVVTGVSFGTTTITARTNNGKTASLTVNVDPGRLELLKDTKFNNGLQLWMDTNEQNYKCVNCKNQQYWYIGSWNFPPKFVNSYYENGEYVINANQADGTNNKLITYNNNGELSLTFNSFGMNYGTSASGWPHLLLDGMLGTSNKQWYFNQYSAIEQKYHSFTGNDIWYHVDVKLNYYTKGQPINGVQALQYLSYLEIHDKKVPSNTVWFGFNLFDDRAANQGSYTMMDEYTQNYIYHLGTAEVYGSMGNSIYNNGNFSYSQWKSVNINLSNYIDDVVKIINQKNLFGRTITRDDLFVSAVNIGFEIHGEYHASMSMKNLQITSIKK